MILNPQFNLTVAPKGYNYHIKFVEIQETFKYVVIKAKNLFDLTEKYEELKSVIEDFDGDIGFTPPGGSLITDHEEFLNYILTAYNFVDFIDDDNYYKKDLGVEAYDHKYLIAVFSVFKEDYKAIIGGLLTDKTKLLCSTFSSDDLLLHKREPVLSGNINTNNKNSRWSWQTDDLEGLVGITFDVSLWRDDTLITYYNTPETHFIFGEHAANEPDGDYELIVVTRDSFGSVSVPAVYDFFLKSAIEGDMVLQLIAPNGDTVSAINVLTPTIKMLNYEDGYNYIFTFNDNEKIYSYYDDLSLFNYDPIENSITFTATNEFKIGSHIVTVEKVDEIGNRSGSIYKAPSGLMGRSYLPFIINGSLVSVPKLVDARWLSSEEYLISWQTSDEVKNFEVYQGNQLISQTVNSFITFRPILYSNLDTFVNIYSYDYLGQRSLNPLTVSISSLNNLVDNFIITSIDSFDVNGVNYINNVRPTFSWVTTENDVSGLVSYRVSLDGSNWEDIVNPQYTFLRPLSDGEYTFRLVAVHKDGSFGETNTFSFVLRTNVPSYPIFTERTINSEPELLEDMDISWLEISDTSYYEYCFNETIVDDLTVFQRTNELSIDFSDENNYLEPGINTILVRAVDIFHNKSSVSRLTFLILDPNNLEIPTESKRIITSHFISKDTQSSREEFVTFDLIFPEDATYCELIFKDPRGHVLESIMRHTSNTYTNSFPCSTNGPHTLNIRWYHDPNEEVIFISEEEKTYLYNSYQYVIQNLNLFQGKINWEVDSNERFAYYEYSLSNTFSPYLTDTLFYGDSIDINKKLPGGDYKFRLKGYDSMNGYLCDIKEFNFTVFDFLNVSSRLVQLPGYTDHFFNVTIYKSGKGFIINHVEDSNGNILPGFVEYKKATESSFTLYSEETILQLDVQYSFIFNKFS